MRIGKLRSKKLSEARKKRKKQEEKNEAGQRPELNLETKKPRRFMAGRKQKERLREKICLNSHVSAANDPYSRGCQSRGSSGMDSEAANSAWHAGSAHPPCFFSSSSNASFTTSRISPSHKATTLKASLPAASRHSITSQPQPLLPPSAFSAFTTTLLPKFGHLLSSLLSPLKTPPSNVRPQMLIQKAIIDCRFLTLFAVLGSLLASALCFIEGFSLVIQTYAQYFHIWSNRLDQGHVAKLLIEAIDMFLVGTGMLIFGVGLYVMFVGSKTEEQPWDFQSAPRWVGIESIGQAKSRIGHAC
ncbi:uncharacterized protein LOC114716738 [Neltuma alba]|uniref:uncharacterized protein LOC114716738 n=1 Tax=Neltuma alba TaxID=207710 RepID=UPI0010A4679E|nr:uncharacterized protein LOC114716738 [Prosopis alba]